ncbi:MULTISPECIES: c-type cytochrome [unclassified Corynebacterium]|uniref:cytochrome bc1 complex diheme cytochrome c subunit n=1 Tax=unclassified Corynebacterium TaxID=2624378 RepID=UPI0021AA13D7|nr:MULTISPECIES: cytochrome c [unclassified Corynebacterium]MCT1451523.1 cytochrome c [Corynebacterium sp. p3-SID1145]MCT1460470.1 cytochrome c [Corynebacterium sp. p3-SID1140]MDN8593584.1 cytochrome c [Corynebacterium sp. P4_F2]WKK55712.1 cytochrome c [Corynebacterium sp. P4-C1]WKK63120.1 cytochrome c [Corynebacterium sp. P8-C1]
MDNTPKKARNRRRMRRSAAGALALGIGLSGAGLLATALTPDAQVATAQRDDQALIQEGKDLYEQACITCHGANLQGVKDRGPSLIGTGEGAVYFQVNSGRMPMMSNDAQAERKKPRYSEAQTLAMAAYVAANGGGPELVYNEDGSIAMEELRGKNYDGDIQAGDVARGSELFRLNCASCHNFTGRGGALSSGKYAPYLDPANEQEIYQAMLTGPQNMPKFSDRQLTADEKRDIIAFIKSSKETPSPAGWALGGIGPVAEGLAMWIIGVTLVGAAAMWIGSRS